MTTKEVFIETIKNGINTQLMNCENESEKMELFSECKELFEDYCKNLTASNYDIWECRYSLGALGVLCSIRLSQHLDEASKKCCEEPWNMSEEEWHMMIGNNWRSFGKGLNASLVKQAIFLVIIEANSPSKGDLSEMRKSIEKLKVSNDSSQKKSVDDVYFKEIGCYKQDMELLEGLMGEFAEFDPYLRS